MPDRSCAQRRVPVARRLPVPPVPRLAALAAALPLARHRRCGGSRASNSTPSSQLVLTASHGLCAPSCPCAHTQPAFGAGLGGSTFGAPTQSAFGVSSAPAFGAASAPAFGAATPGAFGSTSQAPSPFGGTATGAFGAPQPATQPAFGLPGASAAGGGLFGAPAAAAPAFGAAAAGGVPGAAAGGTRVAPYNKTVERDGTNQQGVATMSNFMTITMMPVYQNKSLEELRCAPKGSKFPA